MPRDPAPASCLPRQDEHATHSDVGEHGLGMQRLSLAQLRQWQNLGYGMFITYGMNTYEGVEQSLGMQPPTFFAPDKLDVKQWVAVARDAGMKYVVLTAKHSGGYCLWPSEHTDYHVGNSAIRVDIVEEFVKACEQCQIMAGLYYCTWDNHHLYGSQTPSTATNPAEVFTTPEYRDFQARQIEELLTRYGPWGEVWVDIARLLGDEGRKRQYQQIARLTPNAPILMNSYFGDGSEVRMQEQWPTDLMPVEQRMPYTPRRQNCYSPWYQVKHAGNEGMYYIPAEVCMTLGTYWFWHDHDGVRSEQELLAMRLICHQLDINFLLNIPPNRQGMIAPKHISALTRLARLWDQLGLHR